MRTHDSPSLAILLAGFLVSVAFQSGHAQDESEATSVVKNDRVLFSSTRDGKEALRLYAMKPDGSEVERVGKSDMKQFDASLSPDGKRIVFAGIPGKESSQAAIYVMHADGSEITKLTDLEQSAIGPRWSPDGKQIAFFVFSPDLGGMELYVMNADGKERKKLGEGGFPNWSPDGGKLLYAQMGRGGPDPKFSVLDLKSGESKLQSEDKMMMASFSPDGKHVVYMGEGGGDQADIFIADADFENARQLTKTEAIEIGPEWSADGRSVYFSRADKNAPPSRDSAIDIFALDVETGKERQLTKDQGINVVGGGGLMIMMFDRVEGPPPAIEEEKK